METTTTLQAFYFGDTVEMHVPHLAKIQKIWYVQNFNAAAGQLVLASNSDGSGWMPTVHESQLKLAVRGNLFNHLFGFPLDFKSAVDETAFWIRASKLRNITNPLSLNMVWSLDQAISALSAGRADAFQPFEGMYSPEDRWSRFFVYKAATPEIGRRLRQPSLNRLQALKRSLKANH